jgi:hypothetical protein
MPFMRVMEAGIETRSEWIRLLRKHVGMTVARGFGWIVSIFLVALIGRRRLPLDRRAGH